MLIQRPEWDLELGPGFDEQAARLAFLSQFSGMLLHKLVVCEPISPAPLAEKSLEQLVKRFWNLRRRELTKPTNLFHFFLKHIDTLLKEIVIARLDDADSLSAPRFPVRADWVRNLVEGETRGLARLCLTLRHLATREPNALALLLNQGEEEGLTGAQMAEENGNPCREQIAALFMEPVEPTARETTVQKK